MNTVCGDCSCLGTGVLEDYRCVYVKNQVYPGIFPSIGYRVIGVVYTGISKTGMDYLDEFEGEMYQRSLAGIQLNKEKQTVYTYLVKKEWESLLEMRDWDFDFFLKNEKQKFLSRYSGFERIESI